MTSKKPGWLSAAPAAAGEKTVEVKPGGLTYKTGAGDGTVTVSGRLSRKGAHAMLVQLPPEVNERLNQAVEGGAVSAAAIGLIIFALDELQKRNERLIINAT